MAGLALLRAPVNLSVRARRTPVVRQHGLPGARHEHRKDVRAELFHTSEHGQPSSMSEVRITDIYNYREVDPKLSTSGQPSERQLRAVASAGFEVVINLALHTDPRYSLPDEPGLVRSLGMHYIHIPVRFDSPTEGDLLAFFAALERHAHQKILVHCAANKRATAFLGLFRMIRQGWSAEAAFALMRSVWEPDAIWSSFMAAMLEKHRHG